MHAFSTLSGLSILAVAMASPAFIPSLMSRDSCSTPDGDGTCEDTSSCGGFSVAGYCPGASNIQCCVTTSCSTSSGPGTCLSTSSGCSGGTFIAGACPGDSSIECCVAGSSGGSGGAAPINSGATSLIEQLEGFDPNYYYINGDQTIAYGHDCTQKQDCSDLSPPLSQAQGQALLESDLTEYEACVCALPNSSGLNANQYGALVSFTYNSGCGGVEEYFESYMDSSDYTGICSALPTTNTLGGELSSRREQEGAFCSESTSDASGC